MKNLKRSAFGLSFLIALLCLQGCGRYEGHNGYYFAWKDFDDKNIVNADTNKDGTTTNEEFDAFKSEFLINRGWTKKKGFDQIYDKDGRKISPSEFAAEFRKT
jgi:hypothetical protein